ncbi:hypothetical protein CDD83_9011 [Cordyceps sp. RAO-2017]|nr:hypothetical protein CDD83_9011 [Cordyceps sp. RAO-2017]
MESVLPVGAMRMPVQRQLSRLYHDTKKSSDFVKQPVQSEHDPDIKALHRKLRIQNDRLVSWGLEWSDPVQSAEIDESLSEAGLSDIVESIMSTIKDILAEAEPIWLGSKHLADASPPTADRKPPLAHWDKARFEDLVGDLTTSIDTLYDLPRTRSASSVSRRLSKTSVHKPLSPSDDSRPFESTRVQTPRHVDPTTLEHLRPFTGPGVGGPPRREVVFMSKTAYSELVQNPAREPWAPLLLEYAAFDPIYATTGIMPEMGRFEKLFAGLQQDSRCTPGTWTGLPRLLGYFEEIDKSRLGLVYRFPPSFSILPPERLAKSSLHELPTLSDLLSRPEPPLEAKFSLAFNLTNTIFDMHARGVTHGSLNDGNISFCYTLIENDGIDCYPVDIRRPLVSSFDLFPENDAQTGSSPWRHPSDPSASRNRHVSESPDRRALDLYSLAMALLAIGLWTKLDSLTVALSSPTTFGPVLDSLAAKCGSLYVKAVQSCRHAVDEAASCNSLSETLLPALQVRVSRYLEACCTLDGVSGLEGRLNKELNRAAHENRPPAKFSSDLKGLNAHFPTVDANKAVPAGPAAAHRQRSETADTTGNKLSDTTAREPNKSEAKTRLYPHVPLAPDVVATWNTVLMPQINHALRHFYRKHPESVEVSLESVGPSPDKTHPTVLIVCTSVGKVRAILKKRHGELFDGTSRFRLKVCKGHVLRSRGQPSPGTTSTARASHQHPYSDRTTESEDGEIKPANPDWQVRPDNGASIGACIGYRHLPPASFGGLIIVDNKPYGMTVHHMLDDSDQDGEAHETTRSSAADDFSWYPRLGDSSLTAGSDDFAQWLSDTESEAYSESEITSDYDDDGEEYVGLEPGDKAGIEPGDGEGYLVTQPALDDAPENFHPDPESVDEDHLSSFRLGEVYASSGIRRREENGSVKFYPLGPA